MIRRLIAVAAVLTIFLLSPLADAQVVFGKSATYQVSACINKSDAVLIAETDAAQGHEAAIAIFKKADCATGILTGTITKQVFSIKDPKNDNRTIRVLEVIVNVGSGKVTTAYILTDMPIQGLDEV